MYSDIIIVFKYDLFFLEYYLDNWFCGLKFIIYVTNVFKIFEGYYLDNVYG